MATSQKKTQDEAPADSSEVKRKLAWRMGLAGLMIVGLLGALALFDRLSAPGGESESAAPEFSEPVPVAKKVVTQPVTPAEPAAEVAKTAPPPPAPAPEATSSPVDKSAPRADRPARPEVAAQPAQPAPARTAPAPAHAVAAPAPAGKAAAVAPTRSEAPVRAESAPRGNEAPAAAEPPSPPRLFSGYAVQAGVFSDPRRAEELQARLVLEGIPATIESRVQVGPFKNRAEAEAAREKMKAMGIDGVLLPPRGVKH